MNHSSCLAPEPVQTQLPGGTICGSERAIDGDHAVQNVQVRTQDRSASTQLRVLVADALHYRGMRQNAKCRREGQHQTVAGLFAAAACGAASLENMNRHFAQEQRTAVSRIHGIRDRALEDGPRPNRVADFQQARSEEVAATLGDRLPDAGGRLRIEPLAIARLP